MGYTNVYEFGGINTWDGGIEMKASAPAADRTEKEAFVDGTSNCA